MSELKVFDALVADITLLVAPVKSLTVTDEASCQTAIEVAQDVKAYLKRIEDKRKEMVAPLNEKVKAINEYCKSIAMPLAEADTRARAQINAFAAEQEIIKRREAARIEAERVEAERLAEVERQKVEDALRTKLEAEAENQAEAMNLFGAEDGDMEKVNADIVAQQDAEWAAKQAELNAQAAIRANEFKQRQFDAAQVQAKGTRVKVKVRILDISLIPKEFLIITVNEKALEAVGKTGVSIPGVEFYEDISVAIGARTRMPRLA